MRALTEELPTPSAKEDIAARIKREVEEFLSRGGEIKVIPWGALHHRLHQPRIQQAAAP